MNIYKASRKLNTHMGECDICKSRPVVTRIHEEMNSLLVTLSETKKKGERNILREKVARRIDVLKMMTNH